MQKPLTPPPHKKVNVKLIVAIVLLLLLVPVGMMFCIFPWLSVQAIKSVDEIDAGQVESLSVQLLNHPSGQDDVGPIRMAPEDFARLLEPLRNAEKVEVQPAAPFAGEYKVRFKDGRRGTIRLRWLREYVDDYDAFTAVVGNSIMHTRAALNTRYTIYLQVGTEKYRAKGDALALFELARECAARGKK